MTAGWGVRTVRAAVFAVVCVLLAALGHVMMSGSPVAWWSVAAGTAATGGVGWCLAGRERGLPLIVSVVVVVQGLLHSSFSLAQSATGRVTPGQGTSQGTGSTRMHPMSMDAMDAMDMGSMGSGHMSAGHMGSGSMGQPAHDMGGMSSLGMLAAHLVAALLCGLWLAYGERAAFRILRAVAGRLAAPLRLLLALPTPPHRPRLPVRRVSSDRSPRRLLLAHAITSRGPPAGSAAT
ncbi:hypothetical protein ACFFS2_00375 [Streptomyces aurantiacus]|uniref:Integral-membrane protein n=1 Tax=Streptomyces aurantiacus TaxID=47760 RepID=A0A7G1NYE9_9ACTN|nr:hypothetical protein [Streptomyces aurantiacus]BCL26750.1 hypothetical protein GCM10017557_16090 [Streptomyces aurantiacus]